MKWFKANTYSDEIEEIESTRESEHNVFYLDGQGVERKQAKATVSAMLHQTREEALTYLLQTKTDKVQRAELVLEWEKQDLAKLLAKYPELNL